ncbi:unnamed protein product [Brassicogethes aeneus]|uniref:Uncharacterized protein n=1 Tax=Brassicogethes aeneus TaxID=1431903 RepID=A0A9P0BI10_BRAAE|nr:unnamed protein product [Brassicogethes aeneus]
MKIEPGTLVYPLNILLTPSNNPVELNAYRHWMYESFAHVYSNKSVKVVKIIDFEIKLAKLMTKVRMERTTVDELSKKTRVNFGQVFEFLYGNVTGGKIVVVKNFYYLRSLVLLLKRTDVSTIENYLLWTIIKDLSRETTKYMRNLNFIVDNAVLGVQSDLSREVECTNKIKEYFGVAIIPEYLKLYFNDNTLGNVKEMIKNIKNEFIGLLGANKWLSGETKLLSVEKVNSIKEFVGFPEDFEEIHNIEMLYREVIIIINRRQANKDGVVSQWWPKTDVARFQTNARCFINQYNKYNSNGFLTVGENIADNVGLNIALNALKKLEGSGDAPMMPFLEVYNGYQVFFISFSQMWCEISSGEDIFNEEHSSVKNRVNGTLSNSRSYYTYFNCKNKSIDKKCTLW